jgi:hypothetical protein
MKFIIVALISAASASYNSFYMGDEDDFSYLLIDAMEEPPVSF